MAAVAQTNTGTITGTVLDQQQAVMNGVRITATNVATNVPQIAVTNADGVYSIPALEPGTYDLVLEMTGFKKLRRGPITVESSKTISLDFNLEVGSTSTEVTVTAEAAPLVQQAAATIQYGVDLKQIDELPLANQSALQILTLLPGVQWRPRSGASRHYHRHRRGGRWHVHLRQPHGHRAISGGWRFEHQHVLRPDLTVVQHGCGGGSLGFAELLQRGVRPGGRRRLSA